MPVTPYEWVKVRTAREEQNVLKTFCPEDRPAFVLP
jgi:hypothetical protein